LNDIVIKDKHELVCLFPRSFPFDPIGWGLYFKDSVATPSYPNITNLENRGGALFSRFSGLLAEMPGLKNGVICIGAASSDAGTSMHELVDNLRNYLLMAERKLFVIKSDGGNNDGGFDGRLLNHFGLNYDILKKAIDNYTGTNPSPTPRRTLGGGGGKPPRRKLGG
jgi:hypothetical protein